MGCSHAPSFVSRRCQGGGRLGVAQPSSDRRRVDPARSCALRVAGPWGAAGASCDAGKPHGMQPRSLLRVPQVPRWLPAGGRSAGGGPAAGRPRRELRAPTREGTRGWRDLLRRRNTAQVGHRLLRPAAAGAEAAAATARSASRGRAADRCREEVAAPHQEWRRASSGLLQRGIGTPGAPAVPCPAGAAHEECAARHCGRLAPASVDGLHQTSAAAT